MRSLVLAAVAALALGVIFAGGAEARVCQNHCNPRDPECICIGRKSELLVKYCDRGKLCGNTCIARAKVCRSPPGSRTLPGVPPSYDIKQTVPG